MCKLSGVDSQENIIGNKFQNGKPIKQNYKMRHGEIKIIINLLDRNLHF